MDRQLARRAARARRQRQLQAGLAVGLVVVVGVVVALFASGVFSGSKNNTTASTGTCIWNKANTTGNSNLKDVGQPPTTGEPRAGTETMTITTNLGVITASLDLAKAPCTAASFAYLGSKNFFNNSSCHRLLSSGDHVLQCGDPSGTGQGGPSYTFADEYLPSASPAAAPSASPSTGASPSASAASSVVYPAGTLAMANSGADTNGSQFFIVYKDSPFPPNYTIFGTVTSGLSIVQQVGAAGDDGAFASSAGGGHPKKPVTIQSLTVARQPSASPSPKATASPTPSSSPSRAQS
jgi:peptidyl-prolyl cis-trans isomerase B (cyclophilin B)